MKNPTKGFLFQCRQMVLYLLPLACFIAIWWWWTDGDTRAQFLFSSPSKYFHAFYTSVANEGLLRHAGITAFEALAGFAIGMTAGASIGLSLWYFQPVARISAPYIVALGSLPVFALAPIMIIWFGIGIFSKVMMAALSTVLVALVQAYQGAKSASPGHLKLMKVLDASQRQTFTKVILPSAMVWVMNSMRLNIGFALLGAFIGEFIAAEAGLGYFILKASGLYDMARVFVGITGIMLLGLLFTFAVSLVEKRVLAWKNHGG